MPAQLEGRVFSRLQQFATLPEEFQAEVKSLEVYLTEHAEIFGPHHANIIKTVRSVRAKPLLESIDAWLKSKEAPEPTEEVPVAAPPAEETPATIEPPAAEVVTPVEEATPPPPVEAVEEQHAPPATEAVAEAPATESPPATENAVETPAAPAEEDAASKRQAHGKKLLEGLVLHGYITPHKEQEKLPTTTTPNTPAPLVFKDSELFIPLAEGVTEIQGLTVWQLVDGAVFAGLLKRKAGFLAPLTQGKDVYAVVNDRLKTLTLFETDVGRAPLVHFDAATAFVSFDKTHFVHGIKVWNETTTELLNAKTKIEREALVHALINIGVQYQEVATLIDYDKIQSIYELKDVAIDGSEVSFDIYKGKVLLLVNVSSECGLTPINYPELAVLDEKYRERGLEILAFPCNQFGAQEPGTHDEIKAFAAQYNASFPFFAKGDVNGPETRAVFSYAKAKLPGPEGSYIKWNFAKFLVDRSGQVVKRFAPTESPLSFESEIVTLLFAPPPEEPTEEATAEVTAEVEEAPGVTEVVETPPAPEVTPAEVDAPAPVVEVAKEETKTEVVKTTKTTTLSVDSLPPQQEPVVVTKTDVAVEEAQPETKVAAVETKLPEPQVEAVAASTAVDAP